MADKSNIVDNLNKLIATNYDGERGYKEAAEDVKDTRLKSWFREYSQQRYDFGHELKAEIRQLGGDVEKGTTVAADAHRLFLDIKSFIAGNSEDAVLNEVIRGEKTAIERYDEVLGDTALPASTRTVVSRQKSQIQSALSKIQELEKNFANA